MFVPRHWLLYGAAAMLGVCLGAGAQAAGPAKKFTNWSCEIDLARAGAPVPAGGSSSIFTTNTVKLCTNSAPSANIKITCTAKVPNWTFGNRSFAKFPCQIFRGQCGTPGFVPATNSNLTITAAGLATLQCFYN